MKQSNLTDRDLKFITAFDSRLITLDADGLFTVWQTDTNGDVLLGGESFSFIGEIRPSELFEILGRNTKRLV